MFIPFYYRNGVIPENTKYLQTQVAPAKNKPCLMVDKRKGFPSWRRICGQNDAECMATKDCNVIECHGVEAYPDMIAPYSNDIP